MKGPQAGTGKERTPIRKTALLATRGAAIAAITVAIYWTPAAAEEPGWYGEEYQLCQGTTAAVVQCVDRLTAQWRQRANRAFQALLARQDTPARQDALRDAQAKWLAYRDANCTFYRNGPGSIAAIEAAECMRVLTRRRALDLEQDTAPEK